MTAIPSPAASAPLAYDDYRKSHEGKGWDYHRKFEQFPVRVALWKAERQILAEVIARHLDDPGGASALDFACGTGRVAAFLEERVGRVTGVDIAASMLEVAGEVTRNAELHCADLTRDDVLGDHRFDLITAFRFFPNAEPALRDAVMAVLVRHLAPGGILVFNNHIRHAGTTMRLRRLATRFGRRKGDRDLFSMRDAEVEALLRRHGLRGVERHHAGIVPVLKEKRSLVPLSWLDAIEAWSRDRAMVAGIANDVVHVAESA
ncbi:MAG: class I SAM-dependent methyltransferase [Geminicoccaceae bacterium]|nr:class I SAM-dependent methyltransferase [Geminicoccaceae bacterium]